MPCPRPDPRDNRDTYGPNPAPKKLAVWKREENKLALPWAWAQPHTALVIVGTTEVRSRKEDPP